MNKKNKIIYGVALLIVLAALVIATGSLTNANFGDTVVEGSRGVGNTSNKFLNVNVSGTVNVSFAIEYPNNYSITNVSFMWQLMSNHSLNYTAANGSYVLNNTFNNNSVNDTLWNYTLDTSNLPDGQYNLTVMVTNKSNGNQSVAAYGGPLTNATLFMYNITVDNTPPKMNITSPAQFPNSVVTKIKNGDITNVTFNVTVNDTLTGVRSVIFQFHNTTYFNQTAIRMENIGAPTTHYNVTNSKWGISVNRSAFADANPLTVTVYAIDYANSINKTETFTLNVDTVIPTITLTKDVDNSDDSQLEIDVALASDVTTCTTNQGSVTGSGASRKIVATGLDGGTTYTFTVRCLDDVGNSKSVSSDFTTDESSGGGAASSGSSGSSRRSRTSDSTADADETTTETEEEVTPPAVPDRIEEPDVPTAMADEAAREAPEVTSEKGSAIGWIIGAIILLGLVAAYFLWSKKQ